MANMTIPTSRDIYLELNGKKLAVVQGYSAKALRTSREVEAFGESEPVATVGGQTRYTLELSRLYATDEAIGDGWRKDMDQLIRLKPFADDAAFREKFAKIKAENPEAFEAIKKVRN